MKTSVTIKNLLLTGIVSLTLASCGGGGGGGGGGESHSSGSDYTGDSSSDSSSHSLAPDSLSVGQTFTATISGQTYTLPISSASTSGGVTTGRVQYQGYNRYFRYEKNGQFNRYVPLGSGYGYRFFHRWFYNCWKHAYYYVN